MNKIIILFMVGLLLLLSVNAQEIKEITDEKMLKELNNIFPNLEGETQKWFEINGKYCWNEDCKFAISFDNELVDNIEISVDLAIEEEDEEGNSEPIISHVNGIAVAGGGGGGGPRYTEPESGANLFFEFPEKAALKADKKEEVFFAIKILGIIIGSLLLVLVLRMMSDGKGHKKNTLKEQEEEEEEGETYY